MGYSPRGRKESDMTERLHFHFHLHQTLLVPDQVPWIPGLPFPSVHLGFHSWLPPASSQGLPLGWLIPPYRGGA